MFYCETTLQYMCMYMLSVWGISIQLVKQVVKCKCINTFPLIICFSPVTKFVPDRSIVSTPQQCPKYLYPVDVQSHLSRVN